MNRLEPYFWVAGVLQWLVAASNVFAARIFRCCLEDLSLAFFKRFSTPRYADPRDVARDPSDR